MPRPGKPSALIRPTLDTKFHIDYSWFERTPGEDLRVYLLSHLHPEHRDRLSQFTEEREVDFVDPRTGEVSQLDELGLAIRTAAAHPTFINDEISLVDGVFRVFLRNGNTPMTSRELAEETNRSPDTILKMLSGVRIYKGIRPYTTDNSESD